jgi:hypothetical protein
MKNKFITLLCMGLAVVTYSAFAQEGSDLNTRKISLTIKNSSLQEVCIGRLLTTRFETISTPEVTLRKDITMQSTASNASIILDYIRNSEGECMTEGFTFPVTIKNGDFFEVKPPRNDAKMCLVQKKNQ